MGWRSQCVVHLTLQYCIMAGRIGNLDAVQSPYPAGCRKPVAVAEATN
jgi:hypothetical protein